MFGRLVVGLVLLAPLAGRALDANTAEFFERKVRPILAERCFECHGPEVQKSDLRLDTAEGARRGGSRGAAVVPEDASSLLLQAVDYVHEPKMPPRGKLAEDEIEVLRAWIMAGAVWPEYEARAEAGGKSGIDIEAGKRHWAYQRPVKHAPPAVQDETWPRGDIDRFLLAAMESAGVKPAPPADKRTLIRRVTYDLTGLPPTPEEVEAFLADDAPDAFERVVERLLASPQYGERWGRHWLDVVRYTDAFDSRGTAQTEPVEIWRYRDWVVRAFNDDMPYNEFLRRQIAGDLLPGPDGGFSGDNLVATGVLAIGHWPQGDADKEKMVTDIVDDQIDLVTRGFLATTMACARCHDHKFDPFTTEDYYAMAGIFFSSSILPGPGAKTEGSPILHLPIASQEELKARAARESRIATLRQDIAARIDEERRAWAVKEVGKTSAYILAAHAAEQGGAADPALTGEAVARWSQYLGYGPGTPLPKFERDTQGIAGLWVWRGAADMPTAVANTTDQEVKYLSITQPPRTLVLHPAPVEPARAAWRSPVDGVVRVTGRVADADGTCGNGIRWQLDYRGRGTSRVLAEGVIMNGGVADFAVDEAVNVAARDTLVLSVLPEGEYACDSTVVEWRIAAEDGTAWDLASEVLSQFDQPGPWPDTQGHDGVWWLLDTGISAGADPIVFAPWWAAVDAVAQGTRDADALAAGATLVQEALLHAAASEDASLRAVYEAVTGEQGPFWIAAPPAASDSPRPAMEAELRALEAETPPALEYAVGIQEGGVPDTPYASPQDVRVHRRGDYTNLGEVVPRRMPLVLASAPQQPIDVGSGRLQLADWVASEENPLTARVMVNRIWQHFFGAGLVRTPGDFGRQGEAPTHPELLDWLACTLMERGWSVKAMHRLIVHSAAYHQTSMAPEAVERDPENRLVARMNRKRLDAESLRDSLLAASGVLDLTMGGPAFDDVTIPRRTLYVRTVRSNRSTYTMLFDGADPTSIVPQRTESLVSPQALFLMNHPFVLGQCEMIADRAPEEFDAMVSAMYRRLYARAPSQAERELARGALTDLGFPSRAARTAYAQVLVNANEFMFVD